MNRLLPIPMILAAGLSLCIRAETTDPAVPAGGGFDIPWHSVDGGGELFSSGAAFELSGTVGQWDATETRQPGGGQWRLTGGFWSLSTQESSGLLFGDSFEETP